MIDISVDEGIAFSLDAILNDRLSAIFGAGLSMAPPSELPSAARIARDVKREYEARYGTERDPLPDDLERQAEFFFSRGELQTIFLRTLVDHHVFDAEPNGGHFAVADFLLSSALKAAVSTNVDYLIETAGTLLRGNIGVGLSGEEIARFRPGTAPLLKVHGCWRIDKDHTIWAPSQLAAEPVASRITSSSAWLRVNLRDRDLLVLGFFTDWDYLNECISQVLDDVRPTNLVVVDPAPSADLADKAPALHAIGARATRYYHVQGTGSEFLRALRVEFSRSFVRRVLHAGRTEYEVQTGREPEPTLMEPTSADPEALWHLRRDLEGCRPDRPATLHNPPDDVLLGLTLIQLAAAGAVADGRHWLLNSVRIRVLRTPNQMLHQVERIFSGDYAPIVAPDIVIAVGAESAALPPSIARGSATGSIARGGASRWITRQDAVREFNL